MTGVEVAGVGAFDPNVEGEGIGFVPGWPPEGYEIPVTDDATYQTDWDGDVYTVVGFRTTQERAAVRGITVEWVDAAGQTGMTTFDIAIIWCGVERCSDEEKEDYGPLLRELGVMQ